MLQKVPTINSFACGIIDLPQFCNSLPILPLTWPICGIRQYAQLQVRAKLCDEAMEPFGPIIIWVFTRSTPPIFDSSKRFIKPVFQMDSRRHLNHKRSHDILTHVFCSDPCLFQLLGGDERSREVKQLSKYFMALILKTMVELSLLHTDIYHFRKCLQIQQN